MPKNLTGSAASFPTQTSPLAGEPRTAGSVETPLQNAADRTQWLRDRLDNIDPTREGARRLRRFASVALLRASTDYPDKTIAQVDGVGIYQFDAAATATDAEPFVVTPTAVGAGAGRWLWSAFGALNVANGIPQLDGSGLLPTARLAGADGVKVRAASVRNGLVSSLYVAGGAAVSTTSTTLADVPGAAASFSAEAGDVVRAIAAFTTYGATSEMLEQLILWSGAPVLVSGGRIVTTAPGAFVQVCLAERFTVASAGTYEVRLQHQLTSGSTGTGWTANVRLHVDVIRP